MIIIKYFLSVGMVMKINDMVEEHIFPGKVNVYNENPKINKNWEINIIKNFIYFNFYKVVRYFGYRG